MKLHEAAKSTTTKQKERHIVTWTQQEDDILREQISIHGTENWAIIAAKFKDKTTRQCRRRWYTYLNSDFKKGGWSPEEDMLLCEAQRIFGNRWTEIAKVVSGRTDNAVKNRFSTLCKKRAKHEALMKENKGPCINPNNKRAIVQNEVITNETTESAPPLKKMRTHISDIAENGNLKGKLHGECGKMENQQLRPPFAILAQNFHNVDDLPAQHVNNSSTSSDDVVSNKVQRTFLKRNDPKITALMQQAELLSSLAVKVNTENTDQSLENAWKELQDFLYRTNENEMLRYRASETDFPFEDFRDLIEDLNNSMGSPLCWRQPDLYESPGSSDYSTGSTLQSHIANEKTEQPHAEICSLHQDTSVGPQSNLILVDNGGDVCAKGYTGTSITSIGTQSIQMEVKKEGDVCADGFHTDTSVAQVANFPSCDEPKDNEGVVSAIPNTEFGSPLQVTPLFRTFAAAIPSPKFSESERHFLMKTLGMESPPPNPSMNPSQPPPCKRALLQSL